MSVGQPISGQLKWIKISMISSKPCCLQILCTSGMQSARKKKLKHKMGIFLLTFFYLESDPKLEMKILNININTWSRTLNMNTHHLRLQRKKLTSLGAERSLSVTLLTIFQQVEIFLNISNINYNSVLALMLMIDCMNSMYRG